MLKVLLSFSPSRNWGRRLYVLDGHWALAIGQVYHDETIGIGLGREAGLATEQVEGGARRDCLLEPPQAAASIGEDKIIESVGSEARNKLLGGSAVHVQSEPIVLDLVV